MARRGQGCHAVAGQLDQAVGLNRLLRRLQQGIAIFSPDLMSDHSVAQTQSGPAFTTHTHKTRVHGKPTAQLFEAQTGCCRRSAQPCPPPAWPLTCKPPTDAIPCPLIKVAPVSMGNSLRQAHAVCLNRRYHCMADILQALLPSRMSFALPSSTGLSELIRPATNTPARPSGPGWPWARWLDADLGMKLASSAFGICADSYYF
jgi:hypothetical protein